MSDFLKKFVFADRVCTVIGVIDILNSPFAPLYTSPGPCVVVSFVWLDVGLAMQDLGVEGKKLDLCIVHLLLFRLLLFRLLQFRLLQFPLLQFRLSSTQCFYFYLQ